jgi:hypothetical protein
MSTWLAIAVSIVAIMSAAASGMFTVWRVARAVGSLDEVIRQLQGAHTEMREHRVALQQMPLLASSLQMAQNAIREATDRMKGHSDRIHNIEVDAAVLRTIVRSRVPTIPEDEDT